MPVYRYEGTHARLMGDAIFAFFGAPMLTRTSRDEPSVPDLDRRGHRLIPGETPRRGRTDLNVRVDASELSTLLTLLPDRLSANVNNERKQQSSIPIARLDWWGLAS